MIQLRAAWAEGLGERERLREVLQTALELEHATIPPYLFAAYSLTGSNKGIRDLIRDVAREEMLHMTLVCNILNALGGRPRLSHAGFVPVYPGPLPGTVQGALAVPLAPFSRELLETVFLPIEEPENPRDFPVVTAAERAAPLTIGQFYARIKAAIEAGGEGLFDGDPARQLATAIDDDGAFEVTDVASAVAALDLIAGQGEGTPLSPLDRPNGEPAHYYRFLQIVKGRELRDDETVEQKYSYSGPEIRFDPAGVLPARRNPRLEDFPIDSPVRQIAEQFNRDYSTMLLELDHAFNGEPARLAAATSIMRLRLPSAARQLMQAGMGPTFEFAGPAGDGA